MAIDSVALASKSWNSTRAREPRAGEGTLLTITAFLPPSRHCGA